MHLVAAAAAFFLLAGQACLAKEECVILNNVEMPQQGSSRLEMEAHYAIPAQAGVFKKPRRLGIGRFELSDPYTLRVAKAPCECHLMPAEEGWRCQEPATGEASTAASGPVVVVRDHDNVAQVTYHKRAPPPSASDKEDSRVDLYSGDGMKLRYVFRRGPVFMQTSHDSDGKRIVRRVALKVRVGETWGLTEASYHKLNRQFAIKYKLAPLFAGLKAEVPGGRLMVILATGGRLMVLPETGVLDKDKIYDVTVESVDGRDCYIRIGTSEVVHRVNCWIISVGLFTSTPIFISPKPDPMPPNIFDVDIIRTATGVIRLKPSRRIEMSAVVNDITKRIRHLLRDPNVGIFFQPNQEPMMRLLVKGDLLNPRLRAILVPVDGVSSQVKGNILKYSKTVNSQPVNAVINFKNAMTETQLQLSEKRRQVGG